MQQIGSLLNDLIILGIFVYLLLLISGKLKLKGEKQDKFNELLEQKGKWLKPVVYVGTIILTALFALHVYQFSTASMNTSSNPETRVWTEEDREKMNEVCIADMVRVPQANSDYVRGVCQCLTENITMSYSMDQVADIMNRSPEESTKIIMPLMKNCLVDSIYAKLEQQINGQGPK